MKLTGEHVETTAIPAKYFDVAPGGVEEGLRNGDGGEMQGGRCSSRSSQPWYVTVKVGPTLEHIVEDARAVHVGRIERRVTPGAVDDELCLEIG